MFVMFLVAAAQHQPGLPSYCASVAVFYLTTTLQLPCLDAALHHSTALVYHIRYISRRALQPLLPVFHVERPAAIGLSLAGGGNILLRRARLNADSRDRR